MHCYENGSSCQNVNLSLLYQTMSITFSYHTIPKHGTKKIVSEYDQEIPQAQTADKPKAPRGRATQQSRDTRKTN